MASDWLLWFVQLSGWPVFLVVLAATLAFMLAAIRFLTWAGNRSIVQNVLLASLAVAILGFGLLFLMSFLTRAAFAE